MAVLATAPRTTLKKVTCGKVWLVGLIWWDVVWYGGVWYGGVWCGMVYCGVVYYADGDGH